MGKGRIRVLVVGTSNSVMRQGWVAAADPEYFHVDNRSFGNSTSLFGVMQLLQFLSPGDYDYCIFDFCVNDQTYLEKGLISREQVIEAVSEMTRLALGAGARPVFLALPRRSDIGKPPTQVFEIYSDQSTRTGALLFDASVYYEACNEAHGITAVFVDEAHASPETARLMGRSLFAVLMHHAGTCEPLSIRAGSDSIYFLHECCNSDYGVVEDFGNSYFTGQYLSRVDELRPGVSAELVGVFGLTTSKRSTMRVDGKPVELTNPGVPEKGKGFFCYTSLREPVRLTVASVVATVGEEFPVQPSLLLMRRAHDASVSVLVNEDKFWKRLVESAQSSAIATIHEQQQLAARALVYMLQNQQIAAFCASLAENGKADLAMKLIDEAVRLRGKKPRLVVARVKLLRLLDRNDEVEAEYAYLKANFPNNPSVAALTAE